MKPPQACPQCGDEFVIPVSCDNHSEPGHRHAVLCGRCRALLVLDGDTLRNPTDDEFESAMGSPLIQFGISQLGEMHKRGMIR